MNWVNVSCLINKDESTWTGSEEPPVPDSVWYAELKMNPKIFTHDVHTLYNPLPLRGVGLA